MQAPELTAPERRLELALRFFTVFFLGQALIYPALGLLGSAEFPFVANSFAKDGLFAVLCFIAAGNVRQQGWATLLVIGGHIAIVAMLVLMLVTGNDGSVAGTFGAPFGTNVDTMLQLLLWMAAAASVVVTLGWLYHTAAKARFGLRYLWPHQHTAAMALAEVLVIGPEEALTPEEVAAGIDDFLSTLDAYNKGQARLAFTALAIYPLLRLRPPFALMDPERRIDLIERCFIRDVVERRLPTKLRKLSQGILGGAQQMVFIGYYADPRSFGSTGYVPFSKRKRFQKAMAKVGELATLDVSEPNEVDAAEITADVAIVGSGAAGSVLAHRLAEQGREVVLLEGGRYVNPRDFSEDEREQFKKLLRDGGLQMSTDLRFQVLQGKCVGGSTVVNNAVCYDIPPRTLERWNDPDGLDAGIDPERFERSFARLREWLPVYDQSKNGKRLQAGGTKMAEGIEALGLDGAGGIVDANIKDCLGSGYCNIGCAYGKKLSALDNILPRAQREFPGAIRIFSECMGERIEMSNGRATAVRCRLSDGRELRVSANTVVVSGGALASSLVLQRSGLGGSRAGTGLCFNVGAPLTADFEEKLDSFDGLQITHGYRPTGEDQLILESWFNPVGTQALLMPGWFRDHFHNMRRYPHLSCIGVVVGSQANGRVRAARGGGMKLDYEPTESDLRLMIKGTKLAAKIHFASGALRVMPMTFRSLSFTSLDEVEGLDEIVRDNTDIGLHTSHPQGGNAVSRDPTKGVVDERFRVHGTENVYVCDASVFPSSVTVNPQLTVMAVADYAAAGIE